MCPVCSLLSALADRTGIGSVKISALSRVVLGDFLGVGQACRIVVGVIVLSVACDIHVVCEED